MLAGASRDDAAWIGGTDRQTLRDGVHRFNPEGARGLKDIRSKGHPPQMTPEQLMAFAATVET